MELPCLVQFVRYQSDNGFAILSCTLNGESSKYKPELEELIANKCSKGKYDDFTVTTGMWEGDFKSVGQQFIFSGEFTTHPKYGDQFKAEFQYHDEPSTQEGLQCYLMTLPYIKESRSEEIIRTFGVEETVNILDNDPERLTEIRGITAQRIPAIKKTWERDKALRELFEWLGVHNIAHSLGQKIYKKWGKKSVEVLEENPYKLTELRGVGFIMADVIAHKILDEIPKGERIKACMIYVLHEEVHKNSNLCSPYPYFKKTVLGLLDQSNEKLGKSENLKDYLQLISHNIKNDLKIFAAVKNTESNEVFIYLKSIWDKEKYISNQIFKRRTYHKKPDSICSDKDVEEAEVDIKKFVGKEIILDDTQKESIKSAFNEKVTVITGPGGTGKSTICRAIFYLALKKKLTIRMMSPTGKAAQVLMEKTKGPAATIHRSLGIKPGDDSQLMSEDITEDIVLIDESSMVGIDTMYFVFKAAEINRGANIVFVGDSNQLPSVSPGNFLFDIIKSKCANVIALDKIHRQDENSYISILANDISNGKAVDIPENASDIKWHEISSDRFESVIKKAVKSFISKRNIDDLQIISPMKKGECGVNKINDIMQEMMADVNGTQNDFIQKGFNKFHCGDRVIQLENNYNKNIFNGDIGKVIEVGKKVIDANKTDKAEDYVIVDFYGEEFLYVGEEIDQLKIAYCITVHKFQGSQAPYIFFIMASEARIMMSKELVYTGFTRAQKHLNIYGNTDMLRAAPMKSIVRKRHTNTSNLIKELRDDKRFLKVLE